MLVYTSGRPTGELLVAQQVAAGGVWYLHLTCIRLHL